MVEKVYGFNAGITKVVAISTENVYIRKMLGTTSNIITTVTIANDNSHVIYYQPVILTLNCLFVANVQYTDIPQGVKT